jgi:hypothetical protein
VAGIVGKPTGRCGRSRWGLKKGNNWIGSRGVVTDQWSTGELVASEQCSGKRDDRKRGDSEAQRAVSTTGPNTSAQLVHRTLCSTSIFLDVLAFKDEGSTFFGNVGNHLAKGTVSHPRKLESSSVLL